MGSVHRNPFSLAALAASAVPGFVPARTASLPAFVEGLERAGVIGEDGRRVVVTAPVAAAAGAALELDLHVADALLGTSLRGVIPPVLGSAKLPEGGRAVVSLAPAGAPLDVSAVSASPQLAHSLGAALARIHAVPRYAAEAAGVETFTAQALRRSHRERVERADAAQLLPPTVAQRWRHLLEDEELWDFSPQFVHGDLSEAALFHSGDRISAILGWADAHVGDPASDLGWLISALDPEAFDQLYSGYRREIPTVPHRRLIERAQALGEFALLRWLLHGVDVKDEEIISDAKEMLADLDEDLAQLARDEAEQAYDDLHARERSGGAVRDAASPTGDAANGADGAPSGAPSGASDSAAHGGSSSATS